MGDLRAPLGLVLPARVPGRLCASLPADERLSEAQLVADLHARGVAARHLPTVDAIVAAVAAEARDGDVIVVMSNGGFGGIHGKLLGALR